jgi:hypothetical protein
MSTWLCMTLWGGCSGFRFRLSIDVDPFSMPDGHMFPFPVFCILYQYEKRSQSFKPLTIQGSSVHSQRKEHGVAEQLAVLRVDGVVTAERGPRGP